MQLNGCFVFVLFTQNARTTLEGLVHAAMMFSFPQIKPGLVSLSAPVRGVSGAHHVPAADPPASSRSVCLFGVVRCGAGASSGGKEVELKAGD